MDGLGDRFDCGPACRVVGRIRQVVALSSETLAASQTTLHHLSSSPPPSLSSFIFTKIINGNVGTPSSHLSAAWCDVRFVGREAPPYHHSDLSGACRRQKHYLGGTSGRRGVEQR